MFENTKETIKERKSEISPQGKSTIHKDPIEFSCPLNQPSPFQFNNRLRYGFRQYLNGDKSAQDLVKDMTHYRNTSNKFRNKVKRVARVNMFQNQLNKQSKGRLSKFIIHVEDEQVENKMKVLKRFDKLKQIIERKQVPQEQQNLRSVQLFNNLYITCEENKLRIKQKNLLSERADGKRDFENVRYVSKGNIKVRDDNDFQKSKNINQIRFDQRTQYQKHQNKIKQNIDSTLESIHYEKALRKNMILNQAKKQMILDRKRNHQIYHDFEPSLNKLKEPLYRDVKLYAYIHLPVNNSIQLKTDSRQCQTSRHNNQSSQRHYIDNFNQMKTSRESVSVNSSMNSIMEIHIDHLYETSSKLQNILLENSHEKFVKRIKQFQKIKQLNETIIQMNVNKLHNKKIID
ncbi:hypothetical protein pb186bvf_009258 [Paramecium bursaria]